MESTPLVTIGIPTFNRAASLVRAVESARAQDYPNLEILISDNASSDGTEALCRNLVSVDPRVRYFRQPENFGAVKNFSAVLSLARGEYFMWLGDDDWIDPEYVSACVAALRKSPDYVLFSGRGIYFRSGKLARVENALALDESTGSARVLSYFREVELNTSFYGVIRRPAVADIDFRDVLAGDWLLVAHLAFLGKVGTVDGVHVYRSLDGASGDGRRLAAGFGFKSIFARHLQLPIARIVFFDIAFQSVYFCTQRRYSRLSLGLRAAFSILYRYSVADLAALGNRVRTRLVLRTRLRRLMTSLSWKWPQG